LETPKFLQIVTEHVFDKAGKAWFTGMLSSREKQILEQFQSFILEQDPNFLETLDAASLKAVNIVDEAELERGSVPAFLLMVPTLIRESSLDLHVDRFDASIQEERKHVLPLVSKFVDVTMKRALAKLPDEDRGDFFALLHEWLNHTERHYPDSQQAVGWMRGRIEGYQEEELLSAIASLQRLPLSKRALGSQELLIPVATIVPIDSDNEMSEIDESVKSIMDPLTQAFLTPAEAQDAIARIKCYFEKVPSSKQTPIRVRKGNIRRLAKALGDIHRDILYKEAISHSYLIFAKSTFDCFEEHFISTNRHNSSNLYKYMTERDGLYGK
jgi:hypothetical protein